MPFVFLLLFALLSFQVAWPEADWLDWYFRLAAPWAMADGFWLLAVWRTHLFRRQLARNPGEYARLWRRYLQQRRRLTLLLTACYLGVLYGLGWGHLAQQWAADTGLAILTELIQFAPYILALILIWQQSYRAERAGHDLAPSPEPFVGPWSYLGLQIRHNLLLVVPPVVLTLTLRGVLLAFPVLEHYDTVLAVAGLGLLAGSIISVPLILRLFLGLRPLPAGPLRQRLEDAGRRLGFGFSNILIWDTRHSIANAMVSGTLPWLRYIVLTDLLIERLTPEEIEAVFGHEVGHVKHHHMLLYIVFFIGSLALLTGLWEFGVERLGELVPTAAGAALEGWTVSAEVVGGPLLLAVVAVYIFVVFGYLSRRCERQADLYGCRAVSHQAFITALEKVADLNGIPRHHRNLLVSWQHPSIAERVAFVERLRDNPALEPRFQRSLLRLKLGMMTGLTLGLVTVIALVGPDRVWDMLRVR
jgi:STE24 endopeptidase